MLGLPWPEWGETDTTLLWAGAELRAMRCPCGCGQWSEEAHDPATEGCWDVEAIECYARKAITTFAEFEKLPPHALISVSRMEDEEMGAYDPERAQRMHAAHLARLNMEV